MDFYLWEKFTPKKLGVHRHARKAGWFHEDLRDRLFLLLVLLVKAPLMLYLAAVNRPRLSYSMQSIRTGIFLCLISLPSQALSQEEIKPVQNEVSPTYQPVNIFERETRDTSAQQRDLGFMRPGGNEGGPGYFLQYQPLAQVDGQSTELGFIRQQLRLGAPIYRDDVNSVILSGGVQNHLFQGSAVFPDSGRAFPESLWNVRLNTMYMRKLEDGWMLGLMGGVTIASDEPFTQSRDVNANVMAFLRVPQSDTSAWLFSVFYAPMSELRFPVPGIAYQWQPDEQWSLNLGIPFSVTYRPVKDWTLEANWMPVRNFRTQAMYQMTEKVSLFARWQWINESWFLDDRSDWRERLFYYEMSLTGGVRYQLFDRVFAEFGAGYAFNRFYFNGRNFDDRNYDRVNLGSGLVINAGLSLRF